MSDDDPVHAGDGDVPLTELPGPPRLVRGVTLVVMAVCCGVSLLLAYSLYGEADYAMGEPEPVEVGALAQAELAQHEGRNIAGSAALAVDKAIRYRRPLERDSFRLAPVVGHDNLWVEYRVPTTFAGPRFVPPRLVSGRLARIDSMGARYRGLPTAIQRVSGRSTAGAWMLVDGADPISETWVAGLVALLLVFAGWNAVSIARILRRLPADRA